MGGSFLTAAKHREHGCGTSGRDQERHDRGTERRKVRRNGTVGQDRSGSRAASRRRHNGRSGNHSGRGKNCQERIDACGKRCRVFWRRGDCFFQFVVLAIGAIILTVLIVAVIFQIGIERAYGNLIIPLAMYRSAAQHHSLARLWRRRLSSAIAPNRAPPASASGARS